jgi:excisionase family DNA binding protein
MKISYDKEADALCISLKAGRISKDIEISKNIFAGINSKGEVTQIQFLDLNASEKPWITVDALANLLHKSERTILRWIESSKIRAERVGKEYRINVEDIKDLVA